MLKVAQRGEKGFLVILGFSFANLRLIREGSAVQFRASEVQLGDGVVAIPTAPIPRCQSTKRSSVGARSR